VDGRCYAGDREGAIDAIVVAGKCNTGCCSASSRCANARFTVTTSQLVLTWGFMLLQSVFLLLHSPYLPRGTAATL
jgi:hypothetical protein